MKDQQVQLTTDSSCTNHQVITGSTTKLFLWVSTALEMEETHKKKAEHIVETYSIFHCL